MKNIQPEGAEAAGGGVPNKTGGEQDGHDLQDGKQDGHQHTGMIQDDCTDNHTPNNNHAHTHQDVGTVKNSALECEERNCKSPPEVGASASLLDHSHVLDELIRRANSSWELTMSTSHARNGTACPVQTRPITQEGPGSSPAAGGGGGWFRTWPERGRLLGLEDGKALKSEQPSPEVSDLSVRERAGSDPLPSNGRRRGGRSVVPISDLLRCVPLAYSPQTRQLTLLAEESCPSPVTPSPSPTATPCDKHMGSDSEGDDGSRGDDSDEGFGILRPRCESPSMLSLGSESLSAVVEGDPGVHHQRRSIAAILKRALLPWRLGKSSSNSPSAGKEASSMGLILQDRPPPLPPKPTHEMNKHQQEHAHLLARARKKEACEAGKRQRHMDRRLREEEQMAASAKAWICEVLPHWEQVRRSPRVQDLWWQGLPPCIRGRVWKLAIGNELNVTPELYRLLVLRAEEKLHISDSESSSLSGCGGECVNGSASGCVESSTELIRMDVSRTFPQLGIFQKGGPYHELLRRLLGAYACMRPDVGYVQGMSFLAAVLLLNLEEEEAFSALANLLNRPLQQTLFRMDQPVMGAYYRGFQECLARHLPSLHAHLSRLGLTPDLYLPDWLYTIFARSLPLDLACRVWDVFLRDGDRFLFRTALGLLRMLESELSQLDFIQGAQILNKLPEDLDPDKLFRVIRRLRLKDLVLPTSYSSNSLPSTSLMHPDLPRSRIS